jgi:hypothetical protein
MLLCAMSQIMLLVIGICWDMQVGPLAVAQCVCSAGHLEQAEHHPERRPAQQQGSRPAASQGEISSKAGWRVFSLPTAYCFKPNILSP